MTPIPPISALERLIDGRRAFDATRTLLDNLNSVSDSLIWSEKKSSDRGGIVDYAEEHDAEGNSADPISLTADRGPSPDEQLKEAELRQDQDRCFKTIYASFDGDAEMQLYLKALAARIFKRSEISDLTGMKVETIDELRRKLAKYARRFFGATDFEDSNAAFTKELEMKNDEQGPMENLLDGLDEHSDALSTDELKNELAGRGINIEPCLRHIETTIAAHDKKERLSWMQVADMKTESLRVAETPAAGWTSKKSAEVIAAFNEFVDAATSETALAFRNKGTLSVEDMAQILDANESLKRRAQSEETAEE